MTEKRLVCIGKVAKVHGVKGELKLVAYSGDAAGLCDYKDVVPGGRRDRGCRRA